MPDFHFAKLVYDTLNLGDDLQTEATLPFLENTSVSFNRDKLALETGHEKFIIIMNGWWSSEPVHSFPPAPCFIPVFIGFHIASRHKDYFTKPHCLSYLKQHEPIGCRDTFTQQLLEQHGVKAFFSGCLTTTFEKRKLQPSQETVYLVDTDMIDYLIPKEIRKRAVKISHEYIPGPGSRKEAADNLLNIYRERATLVITSRLHAALTCCAIGVPVVFFLHPQDTRRSTAEQVGLKIHRPYFYLASGIRGILVKSKLFIPWSWWERTSLRMYYHFIRKIDWSPESPDIEKHKIWLIAKTKELVEAAKKKLT